jgi:hypothetical protein
VLSAFSYSFSRVCKLDFNESSSRKFLKNVKPSALNNKVVVALDRKNSWRQTLIAKLWTFIFRPESYLDQ